MSASQIRKNSQLPVQMETEGNNQPLQQMQESRTQQPSSSYRYQHVTLDSATLGAID